jgi:hypothetical protein
MAPRIAASGELRAPAFIADSVGAVASVADQADLLAHEIDGVGQ